MDNLARISSVCAKNLKQYLIKQASFDLSIKLYDEKSFKRYTDNIHRTTDGEVF